MKTRGKVKGIIANLVTIEVDGPVSQNEICFIDLGGTKLMAEVIKVTGSNAFVQVYESTRGLKVGDEAEFQGHMLEVTLGPGILSSNYDGLQNNLETMEGVFLKRGEYTLPLDLEKEWDFVPVAKAGDSVVAADWIGEVKEGWLPHKIMVPFSLKGEFTVKSVSPAGKYNAHVVHPETANGNYISIEQYRQRFEPAKPTFAIQPGTTGRFGKHENQSGWNYRHLATSNRPKTLFEE